MTSINQDTRSIHAGLATAEKVIDKLFGDVGVNIFPSIFETGDHTSIEGFALII